MNSTKKIIIYDFKELFNILNEIKLELDYKLEELPLDKLDKFNLNGNEFYLILNKKKFRVLKIKLHLIVSPSSFQSYTKKLILSF